MGGIFGEYASITAMMEEGALSRNKNTGMIIIDCLTIPSVYMTNSFKPHGSPTR